MNESNKSLEIQDPCHMKWSELQGDGSRRWCDQCTLHVVDGSSMTREEATELVEASDDRVCMRVLKDDQGRIIHAEGGTAARLLRIGLTAAAGVLAACGDDRGQSREPGDAASPDGPVIPPATDSTVPEGLPRPAEIMGEICYPETLGSAMTAPQLHGQPVEEAPLEEDPEEEDQAFSPADSPERPPAAVMGRMQIHHIAPRGEGPRTGHPGDGQ